MLNKDLDALRIAMRVYFDEVYKDIFDEKEIEERKKISDRLIALMTLKQGA